ncbi:MAG: NADH-quinone oxidoreductase subunit NuoE [Nocardioidaceae bacterium]
MTDKDSSMTHADGAPRRWPDASVSVAEGGVPTFGTDAPLPEGTLAELREIASRYPQPQSALLPMLHLVQSVEGCVTPTGIEACAVVLDIAAAEVSAVATFYTMYKRRPVGDYHVGVCTNTLCAVMGGDAIFNRLEQHLDVGNDETTEDGSITLEHVECNAACDYAPVVMVNWEFFDNQTPESATTLVDDLRAGKEIRATRGARLCSWRESERVLAGYPDDRADEGPSGGPATMVGLELARKNHWTAPGSQTSGTEPKIAKTDPTRAAEEAHTARAESETKLEAPGDRDDDAPATAAQDALFDEDDSND